MSWLKWIGLLLAAWLLIHWLTAGHDEIVDGPPEILDDAVYSNTQ